MIEEEVFLAKLKEALSFFLPDCPSDIKLEDELFDHKLRDFRRGDRKKNKNAAEPNGSPPSLAGCNIINLVEVIDCLEKEFGVEVSYKNFFQLWTVGDILKALNGSVLP